MERYKKIDFTKWEILKKLESETWSNSVLVHVFRGGKSALLVTSDGDLYGIGENIHGVLGNVEETIVPTPTKIQIKNVTALASGFSHVVALVEDGDVYSWGVNNFGEDESSAQCYTRSLPTKIDLLEKIVKICCGYYFTLAVDENDVVWFWGRLNDLQPSLEIFMEPTIVQSGKRVKSIACGGRHAAILTAEGKLYIWGLNDCGQIGIPTTSTTKEVFSPMLLSNLPDNVKHVVCGDSSTAVLTDDGKILSWGLKAAEKENYSPEEVKMCGKVIELSANGRDDIFIATLENGSIYHWGDDVCLENPASTNEVNTLDIFANRNMPPVYREMKKLTTVIKFSKENAISQKFAQLFNRKELSDLKIILQNEELYGHKLILAINSPTLEETIWNDIKKKKIDYTKRDPVSVKEYIKFLYTNVLIDDIEFLHIPELYELAKNDRKIELQEKLMSKWKSSLNEENVVLMFQSAHLKNSEDLADICVPTLRKKENELKDSMKDKKSKNLFEIIKLYLKKKSSNAEL